MEGPECYGYIKMDISAMRDGDRAGLAAFNGHSAVLTVVREGNTTDLVLTEEEVELDKKTKAVLGVERQELGRVPLQGVSTVWLRTRADFRLNRDVARMYYSTDGILWKPLGGDVKLRFDFSKFFMGTKFGIFNYATKKAGGHVDVDYFEYHHTAY